MIQNNIASHLPPKRYLYKYVKNYNFVSLNDSLLMKIVDYA
ncbi:hypothetical protein VDIAB_100390 [Vibrio diabolicus]|nr:hypothetical protein VDIAB_100390 [Vibrio diabolicus]